MTGFSMCTEAIDCPAPTRGTAMSATAAVDSETNLRRSKMPSGLDKQFSVWLSMKDSKRADGEDGVETAEGEGV